MRDLVGTAADPGGGRPPDAPWSAPAARAWPSGGEPARHLNDREPAPPPGWQPGADLDRHQPRHGAASASGWSDRLRWDPGRRGVLALGGAVVLVVVVLAWWLARSRPHEVPVSSLGSPSGSAPGSAAPASAGVASPAGATPAGDAPDPAVSSAQASTIVVDVAGKVRHPGIYRLPSGARVYAALEAAGGVRTGVSTVALNLAAPLQDGEQVVVGRAESAAPPTGVATGPAAASSAAAGPVDLNTASLEQLEALPGVGPVLGQNILDWRDAHGGFSSVDQLRQVSGIGDIRLAQLRALVSI